MRPIPDANVGQLTRGRVIGSFVLFFIGWKLLGVTISEKFLYRKDENTGEYRYFEPGEVKAIVNEQKMALHHAKYPAPMTLQSVTQFPLDD
uniref:DUF4124 domain-containing protein n=1 Tax=Panagrellus redivivus TaxID=6233 RepID=A0A7E4ZYJ0_PANRE